MRVEHLNGAVMNPLTLPGLPAHVLLCHSDDGLVLVDSGMGTDDLADPARRLGPIRGILRPDRDPQHTIVRQLEARGHSATDVTHVVLTHLDLDHAGGIADFPHATVHTTADEHAAALVSPDALDKRRYRPVQFAHGPRFDLHEGRGDQWRFGLTGHEVLPGITLVPMPGHSRGHAAVAVAADEKDDGGGADEQTVIHAGDALFDASQATSTAPDGSPLTAKPVLRAFEQVVGRDRRKIAENHRTLARPASLPDVLVIPAHDKRVTAVLLGA